jgi:hypothetical protein
MPEQPFRIRREESGAEVWRYEGPFGPLFITWTTEGAVPDKEGLIITGDQVGRAHLAWSEIPGPAGGHFSAEHQLAEGVTMDIDGLSVRMHRPHALFTRRKRAIRFDRPDGQRRLRKRRVRTYSLEDSNRTRLVQLKGYTSTGKGSEQADVVDVVVMCFIAHTMLYNAVDSALA